MNSVQWGLSQFVALSADQKCKLQTPVTFEILVLRSQKLYIWDPRPCANKRTNFQKNPIIFHFKGKNALLFSSVFLTFFSGPRKPKFLHINGTNSKRLHAKFRQNLNFSSRDMWAQTLSLRRRFPWRGTPLIRFSFFRLLFYCTERAEIFTH